MYKSNKQANIHNRLAKEFSVAMRKFTDAQKAADPEQQFITSVIFHVETVDSKDGNTAGSVSKIGGMRGLLIDRALALSNIAMFKVALAEDMNGNTDNDYVSVI